RRFLRPARRGGLRERRGAARAGLGQDPHHRRSPRHRDVHVSPAAQADLLLGCPLTSGSAWSRLSFWHESAGTDWTPRPALTAPAAVDVAIVGSGYTGLWTAHYLAEADPS